MPSTVLPPSVIKSTVQAPNEIRSTLLIGQGPSGPPGPPGQDGGTTPGSGDLHYLHSQGVAAVTWTINHGLNKFPSVTVMDSAGDQCEGEVDYTSANSLTVSFSAAFAGVAHLN